jgi:hypothetical protein
MRQSRHDVLLKPLTSALSSASPDALAMRRRPGAAIGAAIGALLGLLTTLCRAAAATSRPLALSRPASTT